MMEAVSRRVTRILAISQPRTGPPDSPASAVRLLPVNLTSPAPSPLWIHQRRTAPGEGRQAQSPLCKIGVPTILVVTLRCLCGISAKA